MVKFQSKNSSNSIVFVFLDTVSQCQTSWTAELVKNLSDFVLTNILDNGYSILQGLDEDQLLKEASENYSYAVVLSTGTEFINGTKFFQEVENRINSSEEFFLIGHVPDRDDGYYELHQQCYIINLKKYKEIGCPLIGKFAYYSGHVQYEPIRSEENIHDDYTPTWIKPGSVEKFYKHKWHGWNIISEALKNNLPIEVFSENFRNNKKFYYPNYEPSFMLASTYLYGKQQVAAQTLFYPYNTEDFKTVEFQGPIQQLVIQASGLQFVDYLLTYGYDNTTVVRFVDYNLFALECMKEITSNWKGDEYLNFVKEYVKSRASFVNKDGSYWITLTGGEQTIDKTQWNDIVEKVKFEFRHEDLVLNKGLEVSTWLENKPNSLIHLSHIFNYNPAATFCPLPHRVYSERMIVDKIKKYLPSATIVINGSVEENLKRPTWRMNGDWNEI